MDRVASAPPPAVVTLAAPDWTLSGVGASGLAAASTVLLLLYLTGRFLWVYNKEAAAEAPGATAAAAAPAFSSSSPAAAADASPVVPPPRRDVFLSLLPVLVHMDAGSGPPPECAVCLSAVEDAGRLLPACGHGFHEECIVAWLRLNATCPLCRAAVGAGAATK